MYLKTYDVERSISFASVEYSNDNKTKGILHERD
jgi:hypothetical protein